MNQFDRIKTNHKTYDRVEMLILPTRNEAAIFTTLHIHASKLPEYLKEKKLRLFPYVVYACLISVQRHPVLNRFVLGQNRFEHKKHWISTVVKADKTDESTNHFVKFELFEGMTANEIQTQMDALIAQTRTHKAHNSDRLMTFLAGFPGFIFSIGIKIAALLDRLDLLPNQLIASDPLHTSLVIANLGSIHGQSVAHHLFNWGTCSLVITLGEMNAEGELDVTFTIDERIGEGLGFIRALETFKSCLEDPYDFDE